MDALTNPSISPLAGIAQALAEGCRLRAFRSGAGLRVVRLEKDEVLRGYGEHPHIDEALEHASEDYLAGGRPYAEVYGGLYPHELFGAPTANTPLDGWVAGGNTLDCWREATGDIVGQLAGFSLSLERVEYVGRASTVSGAVSAAIAALAYQGEL